MTPLVFAQILGLMLLANATVYAGIFFMNGGLLPVFFAPLYDRLDFWPRTGICLVTFLILGNIMFAKGFDWFNPMLVAPLNIIAFVLVQIIIAALMSRALPSLMIVPAMTAVCASVYWVYTIINQT